MADARGGAALLGQGGRLEVQRCETRSCEPECGTWACLQVISNREELGP
jgi:hypothetical protein